jgi:hypothetical protein
MNGGESLRQRTGRSFKKKARPENSDGTENYGSGVIGSIAVVA